MPVARIFATCSLFQGPVKHLADPYNKTCDTHIHRYIVIDLL